MKRRLTILMILALVVGVLAPTSQAGFVLKLDDNAGNTITITDVLAGDTYVTTGTVKDLANNILPASGSFLPANDLGLIVFTGKMGDWTVNVDTGQSKPVIGGSNEAELDLAFVNTSTAAGTMTISLTDTGFTLPVSSALLTSGIGGTTGGKVVLTQTFDPDNSEFAVTNPRNDTVLTSPELTGVFSWEASKLISPYANPFSITEVLEIHHTVAGTTTGDASSKVPVPGAVLLGLLGLSAAGVRLRRFA